MKWANWAGLGMLGVAVGAITLSGNLSPSKTSETVNAQTAVTPTSIPTPSQQPSIHRHTITVNLTSMADLKVKEGDRIKAGDVISDRTQQRQQLEAKKQQLEMAIAQMSLPLTQIAKLPEPNLEQEQVALKKAQVELEVTTKALKDYPGLQFKERWLSEAMEPDKVQQQAALKERQIKAAIAVEAALARLSEAKTRYQQEQYQHSIQLAAQQTNLQKQQYDMASLMNQVQEVERELGELVEVRSPYAGRVRRVKVLGQNERLIQVEVTLDIRGR